MRLTRTPTQRYSTAHTITGDSVFAYVMNLLLYFASLLVGLFQK